MGDHGALSLQMGSVTGAVNDLIHGYEQLVHSLPAVSHNIVQMHSRTEDMAKDLEVERLFLCFGDLIAYNSFIFIIYIISLNYYA